MEDVNQVLAHWADEEGRGLSRFGGEPFLDGCPQRLGQDVEDGEWGRVVASGLLQDLLSRCAQDDGAAGRRPVQGPLEE